MTRLISYARQYLACRRLNKLVRARAQSFEIIDYRRRRTAALKATRPALRESAQ